MIRFSFSFHVASVQSVSCVLGFDVAVVLKVKSDFEFRFSEFLLPILDCGSLARKWTMLVALAGAGGGGSSSSNKVATPLLLRFNG